MHIYIYTHDIYIYIVLRILMITYIYIHMSDCNSPISAFFAVGGVNALQASLARDLRGGPSEEEPRRTALLALRIGAHKQSCYKIENAIWYN